MLSLLHRPDRQQILKEGRDHTQELTTLPTIMFFTQIRPEALHPNIDTHDNTQSPFIHNANKA